MKLAIPICFALCLSALNLHAQNREISGRVLDNKGAPVVDARVSTFWRSNGSAKHFDGTDYDLGNRAELEEFWGRLGQMAPLSVDTSQAVTDAKGHFKLVAHNGRQRILMALDAGGDTGGIVELPDNANSEQKIEITLVPLVTVKARFGSARDTKTFEWTHAYVEMRPNPERPLAIDRVISCGSFDGRLEFRLPPGNYKLDAYGSSSLQSDDTDLFVHPTPEFTVRQSESELDLGVLELTMAPPDRSMLERQSKAEGLWQDATKQYGEAAPQWYSIDGRGIDHKKNIGQFKGKWVLLDFWGLSCAPCLGHGIPKMMGFYEKNSHLKDQFEIVGICIDYSGELDTMEKLDAAMEPIEKNVWKGKRIPFPIVLDNTFKTWERYGIAGLGTVVLVDPDGRLVDGDESTLQALLDKAEQRDPPKSPVGR